MFEASKYEHVERLNDEDLMASAFAFGAKSEKATECMHSCTDSCCC